MTPDPPRPSQTGATWTEHPVPRAALVVLLLYLFLVGVNGLGVGFRELGEGVLDSFFAATESPFIGLMIGILSTSIVQSSSVTTSMVVGLVAAPLHPLPVANAIPIIMGANIGTTVTATLVSLGHIGRKEEFRRAFAVATIHDFFNYLTVLVLLPVELLTGYLERSARALAGLLGGVGGGQYESPIGGAIEGGGRLIESGLAGFLGSPRAVALAFVAVSAALIFVTLIGIVKVMRSSMQSRIESLVSRALTRNAPVAMAVGLVATAMVQSSSITTSLLVPLAGAGVLTLKQAFPVTLGANLGTTVTALLAALAVTADNAQAGLTIALVHLLFNVSGTLIIYPFEPIRRIPLALARSLADIAVKSRWWAITYVVVAFYLVPVVFAVAYHVLR